MAVTISLSGSVTLACLFSPKLYIILIHPERNVRQSMMPGRHSMGESFRYPPEPSFPSPVLLSAHFFKDPDLALSQCK